MDAEPIHFDAVLPDGMEAAAAPHAIPRRF
jgi:hypothetical protein